MNKERKIKLNSDEIILDMKKKGITFNTMSIENVKDYLNTHTYYFKLKSYAKNYIKKPVRNKYSGLDFSYLQDLARLDMLFREVIFKVTVDIEHLIKVQIMSCSQNNPNDDGYTIVKDFLNTHSQLNKSIKDKAGKEVITGYNIALIKNNYPDMPIWVLLEIISFGDLIQFYNYYTKKYNIQNTLYNFLWSVRIMRNAAAHNSCILNRLNEYTPENKINYSLRKTIKELLPELDTQKLKKYLTNPVLQDFMDVMIVFRMLDKDRQTLLKR